MTVKEMIKHLKKLPKDHTVYVEVDGDKEFGISGVVKFAGITERVLIKIETKGELTNV